MTGVNRVILLGNLGKDPEIKYLEGNIAVVNFSLATTESYKDKAGNKTEQTEWHNIVIWRNLAENAHKLLKKGMQIYLEGKIHTKQWTDRTGNKKNITEIYCDNFILINNKSDLPITTKGFNSSNNNLDSSNLPF